MQGKKAKSLLSMCYDVRKATEMTMQEAVRMLSAVRKRFPDAEIIDHVVVP
jgi:hypothetical protein